MTLFGNFSIYCCCFVRYQAGLEMNFKWILENVNTFHTSFQAVLNSGTHTLSEKTFYLLQSSKKLSYPTFKIPTVYPHLRYFSQPMFQFLHLLCLDLLFKFSATKTCCNKLPSSFKCWKANYFMINQQSYHFQEFSIYSCLNCNIFSSVFQ